MTLLPLQQALAALEDNRKLDANRCRACAEVKLNKDGFGYLDWLIEGGISALPEGTVLITAHQPITDDNGHGEVYVGVPPPSVPDGTAGSVQVTKQGVSFGNAWFSHEKMTGFSAEQLNSGTCSLTARKYMEWVQAALATKEQQHGA
jgi:hypothetical protein